MKSDNSVSAWCRSLESQDFWKRWYHHLSVDVSFILTNTKSPSPCRNPQPFPPQVPPPSPITFPDPAHTPPHPPQILPTTSKGQRGLHQIFPTTAPPHPSPSLPAPAAPSSARAAPRRRGRFGSTWWRTAAQPPPVPPVPASFPACPAPTPRGFPRASLRRKAP